MLNNKKAGPVTLALGMIFFGSVMLISNFYGAGILESTLDYWPVLLVGLGAEYFVRDYKNRKDSSDEATKFHLPTVTIILMVAFTAFAGQQVSGIMKNQDFSSIINEAIIGDRYSYKRDIVSKGIDVTPGITSVKLDGLNGKVDLVPSTDGKLLVEAGITAWGPSEEEARKRSEMFRVDIKEGEIVNIYGTQNQGSNAGRPAEITYRILVPKGINVLISGHSGQLKADNLEVNLDIRSNYGEVSIRNIQGNVVFEGEDGQVNFEDIEGNLETRLGSGKIMIKDVSKDIRSDSDNSNIEITSSKPVASKYKINSHNGFIVLRLPETSNATLAARTETGKIRGSLDLKVEPLKAVPALSAGQAVEENQTPDDQSQGGKVNTVLGSGKGTIDFRTVSGNIVLDKY